MKISIIIPTYNSSKFIERCLNSIPKSEDIEVIVVDDGSTDNTVDLVQKYDNILLIKAKHKGVSNARNVGLEASSGDYITFLDSDDEYFTKGLSVIRDAVIKHPNIDIIQFNHYRKNPNNIMTLKFHNTSGIYSANKMPTLWMVVWNKVFKREAIEGIKFDTNLQHGEDELFVLESLYKCKKIYCVDAITVLHNINTSSLCFNVVRDELKAEQYALIDFLYRCNDASLRRAVCTRMAHLWATDTYKSVFGDKDI